MTNYTPVEPPFSLDFKEMPKSELKQYAQWYMDIMPERQEELTALVRQSRGYVKWEPDFAPESLESLGSWLYKHATLRPLTAKEKKEYRDVMGQDEDLPKGTLSDEFYSVAFDIGQYLGNVLVKNNPPLRWEQGSGSKRFVDYGQMVVAGFHKVNINPVRSAIVIASQCAEKDTTPMRLRELYDFKLTEIKKNR